MTDPRYPIGQFAPPEAFTREWRQGAIDTIAQTPARLRGAIAGLNAVQLGTAYRDGGWTVRQVVHHVPDSHINAYVRLKLALTEDTPTIKPYAESLWAGLADCATVPVETSLTLLDSLHTRWVALLREMREADFERQYQHPETGRHSLNYLLALYAWHGLHHTAHITELRRTRGW
jgi:DinB superfamily